MSKINRNCPESHEFIVFVENGKAGAICGCGAILGEDDIQEIINSAQQSVQRTFRKRRQLASEKIINSRKVVPAVSR